MKSMAKKLLLLCCILALCLTGCGGKASTVHGVQLTEREKNIAALAGGTVDVLEFSFADDIQGFILQTEIWKYGELLEANVITYGDTDATQALYILHKQKNRDGGIPEITWDIQRTQKNGRSNGRFIQIAFPDCKDKEFGLSSYFWGGDTLKVGSSYILSAENIHLGKGLTALSCGAYAEQEQHIKDSDCVILLRLDTFATAEEAEAEVEARE